MERSLLCILKYIKIHEKESWENIPNGRELYKQRQKLEGAVQALGVQVVCNKFGWRCVHRNSRGRGEVSWLEPGHREEAGCDPVGSER